MKGSRFRFFTLVTSEFEAKDRNHSECFDSEGSGEGEEMEKVTVMFLTILMWSHG